MEAMRKRLDEAKQKKEKVKLIFQYPASSRATFKSGFVKEIYDDGFSFSEIYDGDVVYSYKFLVEIKGVGDGKS